MRWVQEAEMSRWIELVATSPTGKATFVCRYCGDVTPVPAKVCPVPPMVAGSPYGKACHELEAEARDRLIHPMLRNAVVRLYALDSTLSKTPTIAERVKILRADRELILRIAGQAVAQRGGDKMVRVWDILDDLDDLRKELGKK